MLLFELLAEEKIAEAAERGELDGRPGAGRPLKSRYFGKVVRKLAK